MPITEGSNWDIDLLRNLLRNFSRNCKLWLQWVIYLSVCKEIFCFGATKKGYVSTFASTLSLAYLSLIYLYLENYALRLLHAFTIATFQPHSQRSLLPVPKEREFYPNAMLLSFNGTTDKIHSISVWTEHVKHTTSARAFSLSTKTWIRWNGFGHWHQKRFKTLQLIPSYRMEALLFSINQLSFRQSLFPTSPKGNTFYVHSLFSIPKF